MHTIMCECDSYQNNSKNAFIGSLLCAYTIALTCCVPFMPPSSPVLVDGNTFLTLEEPCPLNTLVLHCRVVNVNLLFEQFVIC